MSTSHGLTVCALNDLIGDLTTSGETATLLTAVYSPTLFLSNQRGPRIHVGFGLPTICRTTGIMELLVLLIAL